VAQTGYFTKHPDAGQRAIMLRRQGLTHTEIADRLRDETGTYVSPDGVRQHLVRVGIPTQLGAFDDTGLSRGRYALLAELSRLGRKVDLDDLARAGTGPTRAVALLHSLRKQGLVSFVESTSDMGKGHHRGITRIEITDVGRAALLRTGTPVAIDVARGADVVQQTANDIMAEKRVHDVVALADAIDAFADAVTVGHVLDDALAVRDAMAADASDTGVVAQDVGPTADDAALSPDQGETPWQEPQPDPSWANARASVTYSEWPVLHNLLQRYTRQQRLAALLREAAELADDEGLGVTLLEHADTIPGLSDIELEYLRFADTHHGPAATQTGDNARGGT
jgi:hypothetical protein